MSRKLRICTLSIDNLGPGLCRQLNLSLTAEGIEDAETVKLLTAMGCEEGQGYYFSKAIPAADFEKTFLFPAARENIEDRSRSVA